MGRAVPIWLLFAGCYAPSPGVGAPCDTDQQCPSTQRCQAGACRIGDPGDAGLADAPVDAGTDGGPGGWSDPTEVPGLDSDAFETDPSFTADRLTVAFVSDRAGDEDIWIGTRDTPTGVFTVTRLDAVNTTTTEDKSPELSQDGGTLYFTSNRSGGFDVYRSRREAGVWTPPLRVAALSTSSTESDFGMAPDGLTAILTRSNKLYRTTRLTTSDAWGPVVLLAGTFPTNPTAAALDDAEHLYFHATDDDRDLFHAAWQGSSYAPPAEIDELTTTTRDAAPALSADGRYLMFERAGKILQSSR